VSVPVGLIVSGAFVVSTDVAESAVVLGASDGVDAVFGVVTGTESDAEFEAGPDAGYDEDFVTPGTLETGADVGET